MSKAGGSSNDIYKSFFNLTSDMFCIANFDGYFELVNNRWTDRLGWSAKELTEKPFFEFIHPEDINKTDHEFEDVLTNQGSHFFINRYRHKNGEYRVLSWTSVTDYDLQKIYASARDITDEVAKENILLEMQDIAKIGAWQLDTKNKIFSLSSGAQNLLGIDKSIIEIKESLLFIQPNDQQRIKYQFNKSLSESSTFDEEVFAIKSNGETFRMRIQGYPQFEGDRRRYLSGTIQDVSEEYNLRSRQDEITIQLLQSSKLASLGEISGNIAHEINNPLSIIQGLSNQLSRLSLDSSINPGLVKKYADRIEKTTKRIATIISSLRNVSRNSSSDPKVKTPVLNIVNDTLSLTSERFKLSNIELSIDITDVDLHVDCRPTEISQVLINLLNNSFDAVRNIRSPKVLLKVESKGKNLILKVIDNGNGIPIGIKEKITEPFFTTKPPGEGTGLGLSISKSIIDKHFGTLNVQSRKGHTEFTITVPFSSGELSSEQVQK